MKARVLIVEDELAMRRSLEWVLSTEGYRVVIARDGAEGLDRALAERPDLVLLDVMMPKLDGFAVATALRRAHLTCPILMLTAKGGIDDRVTGLDSGADDYLTKPFSSRELLARVRALLRRQAGDESRLTRVALGECVVDFTRQTVQRGRRDVHLTAKEFAMLRLLAEARGAVVSRATFLDVIWGYGSFPTTRTVDTHIASLRSKLEPDPSSPRWIQTVHGGGYRLDGADYNQRSN
jgi:DNA-binding response OmpR family regulator